MEEGAVVETAVERRSATLVIADAAGYSRLMAADELATIQDFAAGTLLIREAGGVVAGLDGSADPWRSSVVVAGTAETERELRAALTGLGAP